MGISSGIASFDHLDCFLEQREVCFQICFVQKLCSIFNYNKNINTVSSVVAQSFCVCKASFGNHLYHLSV